MIDSVVSIIDKIGLNRDSFEQNDVISLIKDPFCSVWTTVYSGLAIGENRPSVFACFAEPCIRSAILKGYDWTVHPNSFSPGLCISGDEVLFDNGQRNGYHFLVADQYFYPFDERQLIINQEFVMTLELYHDSDGCYYGIGESGEKEKVIDISNYEVKVRTKHLMRYIAARQWLYVQFVDSRVASADRYPMNCQLLDSHEEKGVNYHFAHWYQGTIDESYLLSMIYSRSIVEPQEVDSCGLWPYDEREEDYPKFIIGELPDGEYMRYTCNPDELGTYFDITRVAPHYLTPVYFDPSVLDKYRKNPLFKVTERRIECGSQWGVEIDSVNPDRVMVYLGDLGRDLPERERKHFLQYEISPTGQFISEEVVKNDFFCMFTEPTGPVSKLLIARENLNAAWSEVFGRCLYRAFHSDDIDTLEKIRVPSVNSGEEFDIVILALAKAFVEYIDESQFAGIEEKRSINKFEAFLKEQGFVVDISPLRDLQSLRSSAIAHGKGSKYEKMRGTIVTGDYREDAKLLISRLTAMTNSITDAVSNA